MNLPHKFDHFKALAQKARTTRDPFDIKSALSYGMDNNVSVAKIRQFL
jgi:hypothetical protein